MTTLRYLNKGPLCSPSLKLWSREESKRYGDTSVERWSIAEVTQRKVA